MESKNSRRCRVRLLASFTLLVSTASAVWIPADAALRRRDRITRTIRRETRNEALTIDGVRRSVHIVDPATNSTSRPLVIVLHGHGGSGTQVIGLNGVDTPFAEWITVARREGFVVAAPDGTRGSDGLGAWNDCRADAQSNAVTNDTGFVLTLADHLAATANVDRSRVYVVGMSNGANMTLRLAQEHGDRFAGFGAVAGAVAKQSECTNGPSARRVVMINGTADPLMPFDGGVVANRATHGTVVSHTESVTSLAGNGFTSGTVTSFPDNDRRDRSTVSEQSFTSANNQTVVHSVVVTGGGHSIPSAKHPESAAKVRRSGPHNHDIESAELLWTLLR